MSTPGAAAVAPGRVNCAQLVPNLYTQPVASWLPACVADCLLVRPPVRPSVRLSVRPGDNENIALIPGGFEEATLFARDKHRVYLRRRAGFIKYALRHGYVVCLLGWDTLRACPRLFSLAATAYNSSGSLSRLVGNVVHCLLCWLLLQVHYSASVHVW